MIYKLLIHRVELKLKSYPIAETDIEELLIHRVELKQFFIKVRENNPFPVANPPCGVETFIALPTRAAENMRC